MQSGAPQPRERLAELDGIRGLACLTIVVYHYFALTLDEHVWPPLVGTLKGALQTGWTGVDLFFVLSGFLIGTILLQERDAPAYFGTFYMRRFCRILPLYALIMLILALGGSLLSGRLAEAPHDWLFNRFPPTLSYLTFTQNFAMASANEFGNHWLNITWSLAVEEQFYLVLPLVIRFVPLKRLPLVPLAFICAAPLLRVLAGIRFGAVAPYVLRPMRADALMLGVLIAYLRLYTGFDAALSRYRPALFGCLAFFAIAVIALTATHSSLEDTWNIQFGYTVFALFYGCLLLTALSADDTFIKRLLRLPFLTRIGVLAYGIYLYHNLINGLLHGFLSGQSPVIANLPDLVITLLALVLTVGIAALSYRYFETPFIRFGQRFQYRSVRARPPEPLL